MKILVALLFIWSLARSQIIHPYECKCGVFRSWPQGEAMIYHLPGHHIDCDSPDRQQQCFDACQQDWDILAGNGDLSHELESGFTLGQEICLGALELGHWNILDEIGSVYARTCNTHWDDTGSATLQYICCHSGHYTPCTKTVAPNLDGITMDPTKL